MEGARCAERCGAQVAPVRQHSTFTDGLENDDYRGSFVASTLHLTPFHGNPLVAQEPRPVAP